MALFGICRINVTFHKINKSNFDGNALLRDGPLMANSGPVVASAYDPKRSQDAHLVSIRFRRFDASLLESRKTHRVGAAPDETVFLPERQR